MFTFITVIINFHLKNSEYNVPKEPVVHTDEKKVNWKKQGFINFIIFIDYKFVTKNETKTRETRLHYMEAIFYGCSKVICYETRKT